MHACLLIPETLKCISSDIYDSGMDGRLLGWDRGCLIKEWRDALELLYFGSRRAFKAIALDVLWVELEISNFHSSSRKFMNHSRRSEACTCYLSSQPLWCTSR
jgi:hypothetical protein